MAIAGLVLDNVLHLEPGFVFVKTLAKNELAHVATISEEVLIAVRFFGSSTARWVLECWDETCCHGWDVDKCVMS